ncbi:hypothetical protein H0H81_006805 [Sphagnurus paluster]|uniref:Uncharacterized protein n=1 Tax=Sphagnurus paluster TaxID=117069 RepID=A0A9P7GR41_9AGAR|nr:hypothetical protein H0H81_006805 [Sphagnurus paluster]
MTEYDFSPEAYQAHLANMHRISKWVDRTEEHRPEFGNAAALVDPTGPRRPSAYDGHHRQRAPPPPPLLLPGPPLGAPFSFEPGHSTGMAASLYTYGPSPPYTPDVDFMYARGPGSPGPMPLAPPQMHMHHGPPHYTYGTCMPYMARPRAADLLALRGVAGLKPANIAVADLKLKKGLDIFT